MAVRSSATAEDLPSASFAGQHESYLNIVGGDALLEACRRCFASLFTDRATHYRMDQGFDRFEIGLSVGVMKMIRADLAASGVIFTLDTESGFRDAVLITGAYGLGENVVQGAVNPDEFTVFKPTFEAGHRVVLRRRLGSKEIRMVYARHGEREATANIPTPQEDRERYCLTDSEVMTLAADAIAVERHYSERAGGPRPMDLEWAKDGIDGQLYMLQARPETVLSQKSGTILEEYSLQGTGPVLATGRADLTQLVLGVDRDSEIVAFDFDERDPGVIEMIRLAIEGSRRNGRHSGICGQVPSDSPEITEFLIEAGIDSISLNPDSLLAATRRILEIEARLASSAR